MVIQSKLNEGITAGGMSSNKGANKGVNTLRTSASEGTWPPPKLKQRRRKSHYQIPVRRGAVEEEECLAGEGIRKRRGYYRPQLERHALRFPNFKLGPAGSQWARKPRKNSF